MCCLTFLQNLIQLPLTKIESKPTAAILIFKIPGDSLKAVFREVYLYIGITSLYL